MSAAHPIHVALKAVIEADSQLTALGATYHAGEAPPKTRAPYIVNADATENRGPSYFGAPGWSGTQNLHIWANTYSAVLDIYRHIDRLLQDTDIGLEEHSQMSGTLRLVTVLHDPTDLYHGVAEYSSAVIAMAVES